MSDQSVDNPDDVGRVDCAPEVSAATIEFSLPAGIYAFKIKSGGATERYRSTMALPAVKIDLAPIEQEATVDFLGAPTTRNNYLAYDDDVVVARVAGGTAQFLLVSLRMPGQDALALDIVRLDIPSAAVEGGPVNEVFEFIPDWTLAPEGADDDARRLPVQIMIQLPTGDRLEFGGGWACAVDDVEWIEAFAITPADRAVADLLEYGAIAEGQASSDWCAAGALCGIPGSNVPLLGFAVRAKPGVAAFFDCFYFGVFASGTVVGPIDDGALCESELQDDPLIRIDVRLVERLAVASA
jgi:hypothetical protein